MVVKYVVNNCKYVTIQEAVEEAFKVTSANLKSFPFEHIQRCLDYQGSCTISKGKDQVVIYKRSI